MSMETKMPEFLDDEEQEHYKQLSTHSPDSAKIYLQAIKNLKKHHESTPEKKEYANRVAKEKLRLKAEREKREAEERARLIHEKGVRDQKEARRQQREQFNAEALSRKNDRDEARRIKKEQKETSRQELTKKQYERDKKKELEKKISDLVQEIRVMQGGTAAESVRDETAPPALEKMGRIEVVLRNKLARLARTSITSEQELTASEGLVRQFDAIKQLIRKTRMIFAATTGLPPTIENMSMRSNQWSFPSGAQTLQVAGLMRTIKDGENTSAPSTKIYLNSLSESQKTALFETFGFGNGASMEKIVEKYNDRKSTKSKIDLDKKHFMIMPTNVGGVFLGSENYGELDGIRGKPNYGLVLGTKFIEEVFDEQM